MDYVHLKTGHIYDVVSLDTINATNAQDGQRMVAYIGEKKDGSGKKSVFVREYSEFMTKFAPKR